MAVFNLAYCRGVAVARASDDQFTERAIPAYGRVMLNAAGDERLVSNTSDITGADEVAIPTEARTGKALLRCKCVSGSGYIVLGQDDTAIAAGEGLHLSEGQTEPFEVGPDDTHVLIFGA